jgi:dTDP-4-amino-4,6-dideoxygalactose transaminase
VDALQEIADKYNLKLIFDAAHAFGCTYHGNNIGQFGDAEIFSFHATKTMNAFEGGAVTTNNAELAKKMRLMKNFGFSGYDQVTYIGTNGKMSEIAAAMGITSFESLAEFVEVNREHFELYEKELSGRDDLLIKGYSPKETTSYPYVVIELLGEEAPLLRDVMVQLLHAENIIARRYFYPGCHNMEPYRSHFPNAYLLLPETEDIMRRVVCLPTGTTVTTEAVQTICHIIRLILDNKKTLLAEFDAASTSQHSS